MRKHRTSIRKSMTCQAVDDRPSTNAMRGGKESATKQMRAIETRSHLSLNLDCGSTKPRRRRSAGLSLAAAESSSGSGAWRDIRRPNTSSLASLPSILVALRTSRPRSFSSISRLGPRCVLTFLPSELEGFGSTVEPCAARSASIFFSSASSRSPTACSGTPLVDASSDGRKADMDTKIVPAGRLAQIRQ